jgi:hypothetical protein
MSLRADAARRVEQLRVRIVGNARYQEGEELAEDAQTLLTEAGAALDDFEALIRRINRTNAIAPGYQGFGWQSPVLEGHVSAALG